MSVAKSNVKRHLQDIPSTTFTITVTPQLSLDRETNTNSYLGKTSSFSISRLQNPVRSLRLWTCRSFFLRITRARRRKTAAMKTATLVPDILFPGMPGVRTASPNVMKLFPWKSGLYTCYGNNFNPKFGAFYLGNDPGERLQSFGRSLQSRL
jgi:hypothetical protein